MARYRSETHPTNRHRGRRLNHSHQQKPQASLLHLATLSLTRPNSIRQKLWIHQRQDRDPSQLAHADLKRYGLSARAAATHVLQLLSLLRSGTEKPPILLPRINSTEPGPTGVHARDHWLERISVLGDDLHYLADLRDHRRLSHTSRTTYTGKHQLRMVAVLYHEGGLPARHQRQILGNGGGRMVQRIKQTERAPCLSVLRACTAANGISELKSTRRKQAMASPKGCSTIYSPMGSTDFS